jgi:hypothetical protein
VATTRGSLQVKDGKYYAVLSFKTDEIQANGKPKYKTKWFCTGYTVKGNLLTLRAKVGIGLPAPEYYKVEENRLRRLNAKKQPITGELADQYVLTK